MLSSLSEPLWPVAYFVAAAAAALRAAPKDRHPLSGSPPGGGRGAVAGGRQHRAALAQPSGGDQLVEVAEDQGVDLADLDAGRLLAPASLLDTAVALDGHGGVGARAPAPAGGT